MPLNSALFAEPWIFARFLRNLTYCLLFAASQVFTLLYGVLGFILSLKRCFHFLRTLVFDFACITVLFHGTTSFHPDLDVSAFPVRLGCFRSPCDARRPCKMEKPFRISRKGFFTVLILSQRELALLPTFTAQLPRLLPPPQ